MPSSSRSCSPTVLGHLAPEDKGIMPLKCWLTIYHTTWCDSAVDMSLQVLKIPSKHNVSLIKQLPGPSGLPGGVEAVSTSALPSSIMKRSSTVPPSLRPITTLTSPLCFNRQCLCTETTIINTLIKLSCCWLNTLQSLSCCSLWLNTVGFTQFVQLAHSCYSQFLSVIPTFICH